MYKIGYRDSRGVLGVNVRPFSSKKEAERECEKLNKENENLGRHVVLEKKV